MKFNISMKMVEWNLKMRLFYMNYIKPNMKWIYAGLVVFIGAALIIGVATDGFKTIDRRYYYIDYQGNKGVADWCGVTEAGLVCDRSYGGKILVTQYWKG